MKFSVPGDEIGNLKTLESGSLKQPVRTLDQLEKDVEGDELLEELLKQVFDYCIKYAGTVARYNQILSSGVEDGGIMDKELEELEPVRTAIHNGTVDTINAFSRQLGKAGKDNSWVGDFGGNRAAYVKFALLIAMNWIHDNPQ